MQAFDRAVPQRLKQLSDAIRDTGVGRAEFIPHGLTADSRALNGGPGGALPGQLSPRITVTTPKDGPYFLFGLNFTEGELGNLVLSTMVKLTIDRANKPIALRHNRATVAGGDNIGWWPMANVAARNLNFWALLPYPIMFGPNDRFSIQYQDPRPPGPGNESVIVIYFLGFKALIYP